MDPIDMVRQDEKAMIAKVKRETEAKLAKQKAEMRRKKATRKKLDAEHANDVPALAVEVFESMRVLHDELLKNDQGFHRTTVLRFKRLPASEKQRFLRRKTRRPLTQTRIAWLIGSFDDDTVNSVYIIYKGYARIVRFDFKYLLRSEEIALTEEYLATLSFSTLMELHELVKLKQRILPF